MDAPDNKPSFEEAFGQQTPAAPTATPQEKPTFDEAFGAAPTKPEPNEILNGVVKSMVPVIGQVIKNNEAMGTFAAVKSFNQSMADPGNALFTPEEQKKEAQTGGFTGAAMDVSAALYDVTFRPLASIFNAATAGLNKAGEPIGAGVEALGKASGERVGGPGFHLGDFLLNDLPSSTGFLPPGEFAGVPHASALESYAIRAPENVYMGTKRPSLEQEQVATLAAKATHVEEPSAIELPEGEVPPQKPEPAQPQFSMPWDYKAADEAGVNPETTPAPAPMQESSEQPSVSSAPFEETRLMDKAGNIRLDNINTTDDLKQVLLDSASRNDDFNSARRGVLSDGKILDLADAFGINPAFLDKRAIGEAYSAEQIKVVEKALAQSTASVRDEMIKFSGSEKGEPDIASMQAALARHDMIQETYAGVTAEAGRALRALRKSQSFWESESMELNDYLKRRKEDGATASQLEDIAKFGAKLKDPRSLAKFLNDSKRATFKDQVLFYYLNSLLSGPITHLRYSAGNMLNAIATPLLEIPAAAASGYVREKILGQTVEDRVRLGEAGKQLYAIGHGSTEGMRAAIEAWKNNFSAPLPGERGSAQFSNTPPIPGAAGKVIGVPSRAISSIHSFTKTLRYEQNIAGLAYRQAVKEGLEGEKFNDRVSDLTSKPTDKMMDSATKDALKETYMEPTDYHSFMGSVQRITNDYTLAKIMVPFAKVGGQITKNAFLERTPLGIFNEKIRDNLMGKNGDVPRDMQVAKMSVGTMAVAGGVMMALHGKLTGDGPEDPKQRATWLLTHQPNTIQVGNVTIPYRGLGPYGMLLGFSANMTETAHGWDGKDGHKLAVSMLEGMTKSVLDQNFMLGVKNALDAVYHPEEYGDRYLRDFATNWLPFSVGMGQVARQIDPYQRNVTDIFAAARSKIPVASESLTPRYDMFGNPIKNGSTYAQYSTDPVVQRLEALHTGIGRLEDKINGVKLTDQQYADYSRIAGRTTYMMLSSLVANGLQYMPPGEQLLRINRTIDTAREVARNTVKLNPANANIIQEAVAKKRAIFSPTGDDEP